MGDLKTIPVHPDRARQKTEPLNKHETKQLICITGQLNWLSSTTTPDIAYSVLELSASLNSPRAQTLLLANKTVKMTKANFFKLKIPQLAGEWRIVVYSDASHGNLPDGYSSSLGFIIFLADFPGNSVPIAWKSGKIHRVVRSTLASETLALVEAVDSAFYVNSGKVNIPIECFIDNQSLVENVHSTKSVSEFISRR